MQTRDKTVKWKNTIPTWFNIVSVKQSINKKWNKNDLEVTHADMAMGVPLMHLLTQPYLACDLWVETHNWESNGDCTMIEDSHTSILEMDGLLWNQ